MKKLIVLGVLVGFSFTLKAQNTTYTVEYYNRGQMMQDAAYYDIMIRDQNNKTGYKNFKILNERLYNHKALIQNIKDDNKRKELYKLASDISDDNIRLLDFVQRRSYDKKLHKLESKLTDFEYQIKNNQ